MATRRRTNSNVVEAIAVMGDTGLRQSGGRLSEEYARGLKGTRGVEQFQEMADSALPGAFLLLVDMLTRGAPIVVRPATPDDPAAEAEAEFLRTVMADMDVPWGQVQGEALIPALVFGWSRAEMVFKLRRGPNAPTEDLRSAHNDGRWGLRDLSPRSADSLDRWEFDPRQRDRVIGMHQRILGGQGGAFYVPERKMVTFIPRPWKRSPEGRSTLRAGHRSWFYARKLEDTEALGFDKELTNIPHITLPMDIMKRGAVGDALAVRTEYEDKARKLRMGQLAAIIMPPERDSNDKPTGYSAKPWSSAGARMAADPAIRRHESRLLISLMSEFMLLGTGDTGSRAVADPKINLVNLMIEGLLAGYDQAVNSTMVAALCRLNCVPRHLWPRVEHGAVDTPTVQEVVMMLNQLLGAGAVLPSRKLSDHALSLVLGDAAHEIAEPDDEDDTATLAADAETDATRADASGPTAALPPAEA